MNEAKSEYVYLIRQAGYHKIGRSNNPHRRLARLDIGPEPAELVHTIPSANSAWLEGVLHDLFAGQRMRGEWFRLSPSDVAAITGIARADSQEDVARHFPEYVPAAERKVEEVSTEESSQPAPRKAGPKPRESYSFYPDAVAYDITKTDRKYEFVLGIGGTVYVLPDRPLKPGDQVILFRKGVYALRTVPEGDYKWDDGWHLLGWLHAYLCPRLPRLQQA